ncbi:putative F420-dependent oxidoreductase [Marmoricola sp. OAE513]|uniref:TIGR03619 family F420-dependent LLM class oxidoreductase n=1 Tax=Marmoricola sp. OAE513 TaxID=2817894 RepID=UPI001AE5AB65
MRFSITVAFQPVDQLAAIAKAADECGYDAISIPDHVVDLETLETPYPYTPDGKRRWEHSADWPDPWVLAGALAAVTTNIHFYTSVYVAALRSPYQVAKSVGTAAALSGNRVALGVGVGWCREEFELMGQDFSTRGKRTDEALALLAELWSPGWNSFEGEFYPTPRLVMEPTPTARIPIYVGGLSEVGMRRAARHDGWIGDLYSTEEAAKHAKRLAEIRDELGREGDFRFITALTDAFLPEQFAAAEEVGVTDVWTMPWAYYHGLECSLEQKIDGIQRFAADILEPLKKENG